MTSKQLRHARWLALLAFLAAREAIRHAAQLAKYRHARHLRRLKMYGPTYGQPTLSYDDEVLADSPLSYWKLDETSGPVLDSAGAVSGTPAGTLAQTANGLDMQDFDARVDFGDHFHFDGSAAFSLEAWLTPGASTQWRSILQNLGFAGGAKGWTFLMRGSGVASPSNRIELAGYGGAGGQVNTEDDAFTPDVLTHVVATHVSGEQHIWVNGADMPLRHGDSPVVPLTAWNPSVAPMYLGGDPDDNEDSVLGLVRRVAIYDHALTAERIAAHYAAGIAA